MVDAYVKGDSAGAQALSARVNRAAGIEQPLSGPDPLALAPMAAAPKAEVGEVDRAIATLNELGGEHAALVQEWQQTGANAAEELGYAKAAFRDIVANRPDLIAKVDASGLGNDPAVLKLLAKHGRLNAGMMGDFTVARNNAPSEQARVMTPGRGGSSAQAELNQLMHDNPPGSDKYKNPRVQSRVAELSRMIASGGSIVGSGGRTA
jgi:hypothetical protein